MEPCELEARLRRELAAHSRRIARLGYAPGTSGNLSVRLDATRLLLTPTGVSKAMVRAADMVVTDLQGRLLMGTRRVTSEVGMHLAIYSRRPDVHAVIHAHPPIATAFSCCGRGLDEPLCQEAVMTVGSIPLACYATTGTDEVAASLEPWVDSHDAILLENHGAVTAGTAPAGSENRAAVGAIAILDAFLKMETMEHIAQVALVAHQLGTAQPLQPVQVQQLCQAKFRYLQNASLSHAPEAAVSSTELTAVA